MLLDESFTEWQWAHVGEKERHCKDCARKGREEKPCARCKKMLLAESFTEYQWAHIGDKDRHCKDCARRGQEEKPCARCKKMLLAESFTENQWANAGDKERHCKDCAMKRREEKICSKCKESKSKAGFTPKQWQQGAEKRRCEQCVVGVNPKAGVTCRGCERKKPRTEFTLCKPSYVGTRLGRCNDCLNELRREEREVAQAGARKVQRKSD